MSAGSGPLSSVVAIGGGESDESTARLLHDLERRARAEADAVLAAARAEAERIGEAARAHRSAARQAAIASCEASAAGAHAERLAQARLEARRTLLLAQHAAVERVLGQVRLIAYEIGPRSATFDEILEARVADVLSYLGGAPAELRCAPAIAARVTPLLRETATTALADESIVAGIRAVTRDGRVMVDDTLDAWLARERSTLAIEICRELGSPDD